MLILRDLAPSRGARLPPRHGHSSVTTRWLAIVMLSRADPELFPQCPYEIRCKLHDSSEVVRTAVVDALGKLDPLILEDYNLLEIH